MFDGSEGNLAPKKEREIMFTGDVTLSAAENIVQKLKVAGV